MSWATEDFFRRKTRSRGGRDLGISTALATQDPEVPSFHYPDFSTPGWRSCMASMVLFPQTKGLSRTAGTFGAVYGSCSSPGPLTIDSLEGRATGEHEGEKL